MDYLAELKKVFTPEQVRFFELLGPPSLVAGEDARRYWGFVIAIFQCVKPNDFVDFIYQRDLIDLEWDVLRYRTAKAELINERAPFDFAALYDDDDDDARPSWCRKTRLYYCRPSRHIQSDGSL